MKILQLSSVFLALGRSYASESAVECRESEGQCGQRVQVNASSVIGGLIDDVPVEVYEAFVTASTECLQCVEESNVQMLSGGTGHYTDDDCNCNACGEWHEIDYLCQTCCGVCRCQGCEWERGMDPWGLRLCDDCCVNPGFSAATITKADELAVTEVDFNINVCMDNVNPLDPATNQYVDHVQMLADFEAELQACYQDTDSFLDSWSSLCAESGIDLSLMARGGDDGRTLMFGTIGLDSENAVVTTYSSDESHRSTSHMIFYAALGFVTVSAFAIFGTAVVVKVLNKRKEAKEAQEAQWVSEMTEVDVANPVGSGA